MPGPAPKRDDQRRNKATLKADKLYTRDGDLPVKQPAAPKHWDKAAKDWYRSLKNSAQAVFYEPSDWQTALVAGHLLDEWMGTRRATTMGEFRMLTGQLLATEGDRRRARLEIHRKSKDDQLPGNVTSVEGYKARLGIVAS